jgi:hypothetical protein
MFEGTGQGHVIDVVSRRLGVRSILAPSGDSGVHQAGIAVEADIRAQTKTLGDTGTIPFQENVGPVNQPERSGHAIGMLQVDGH